MFRQNTGRLVGHTSRQPSRPKPGSGRACVVKGGEPADTGPGHSDRSRSLKANVQWDAIWRLPAAQYAAETLRHAFSASRFCGQGTATRANSLEAHHRSIACSMSVSNYGKWRLSLDQLRVAVYELSAKKEHGTFPTPTPIGAGIGVHLQMLTIRCTIVSSGAPPTCQKTIETRPWHLWQ